VGYFVADQAHALDPVDAAQRGFAGVPNAHRRACGWRIEAGLGADDDDKVGGVDQLGGELSGPVAADVDAEFGRGLS
jgi:hypothetical protein